MIIKEPKGKHSFYSKCKSFFNKHRQAKRTMLILIIISVIVGSSLMSMYYGAALYRKGHTATLKAWALSLVRHKLSFIPNFINGLLANPEHIDININYTDYQQLAYQREAALANGIFDSSSASFVPARIRYRDKTMRARMRLKGRLPDHWSHDAKWSFRIRLQDDNTILGMKTFSIHHPRTREFLNEWYYRQLLKYSGLISKRYDFIDVTINGRHLGIYALDEHFDKILVEHNHSREGPIIRFNADLFWQNRILDRNATVSFQDAYWLEEIDAYRSKRIMANPELSNAFHKARSLLESFRCGKLPAHQVFDMEKTAKLFAISDLYGHPHAHERHNVKFYYNPITSLLEPIGSESQALEGIKCLAGSADQYPRKRNFSTWEKRLFEDKVFLCKYIQALKEMADKAYLDDFFEKIRDEEKQKVKILHRTFPEYNFEKRHIFYENQKYIQNTLNPVQGLQVYFKKVVPKGNLLSLELGNIQSLPIEVLGVSHKSSVRFYPVEETILSGKAKSKPVDYQNISFFLPDDLIWSDELLTGLKVQYRILGDNRIRYETIYPWPYLDDSFIENDFIRQPANIYDFDFLTVDKKSKTIFFKSGRWNLTHNLIIPEGWEVTANEGLKLNLSNSAKILSYSPLIFVGSEEYPIVIHSSDSTGQGIIVMAAKVESLLEYVNFDNLSNPSQKGWELTGAVTFYESPVRIAHCYFSRNRSEDALNIIRSRFEIDNTLFREASSDAFDADFCQGKISNSSFFSCGNDAVDISGSIVEVSNIFINKAGDKGLSVGENSRMKANAVEVKNAEFAIASKDTSELNITNTTISNCKIGFALYQKKPEFGPACLTATGITMDKIDIPYLVEEGSQLYIKGKKIESDQRLVKEILKQYLGI